MCSTRIAHASYFYLVHRVVCKGTCASMTGTSPVSRGLLENDMNKVVSSLVLVFLVLSCTIKASPIVPDKAAGVSLDAYVEQLSRNVGMHVVGYFSPLDSDEYTMRVTTKALELASVLLNAVYATQALSKLEPAQRIAQTNALHKMMVLVKDR